MSPWMQATKLSIHKSVHWASAKLNSKLTLLFRSRTCYAEGRNKSIIPPFSSIKMVKSILYVHHHSEYIYPPAGTELLLEIPNADPAEALMTTFSVQWYKIQNLETQYSAVEKLEFLYFKYLALEGSVLVWFHLQKLWEGSPYVRDRTPNHCWY